MKITSATPSPTPMLVCEPVWFKMTKRTNGAHKLTEWCHDVNPVFLQPNLIKDTGWTSLERISHVTVVLQMELYPSSTS